MNDTKQGEGLVRLIEDARIGKGVQWGVLNKMNDPKVIDFIMKDDTVDIFTKAALITQLLAFNVASSYLKRKKTDSELVNKLRLEANNIFSKAYEIAESDSGTHDYVLGALDYLAGDEDTLRRILDAYKRAVYGKAE